MCDTVGRLRDFRFFRLRTIHQSDDARQHRLLTGTRDRHGQHTFQIDRTPCERFTRAFHHRSRLTGEQGLIGS